MEHLNYCRKVLEQFEAMAAVPSVPEEKREVVLHVIDLCRASQKFLLPEGGTLFDDDELRALDDSQPLHLPYQFIALEYIERWKNNDGVQVLARRILFVREGVDGLYVKPAAFIQHNGFWAVKNDFRIPLTGYLDRSNKNSVVIKIDYKKSANYQDGSLKDAITVFSFLNALACSNVRIERSEPRKAGKKIKAALPFDTYHVLTIDAGKSPGTGSGLIGVSHRSPREHLRRGHIRRLEDGRRIWVNATVVAAGRGAAKVGKDYLVKARFPRGQANCRGVAPDRDDAYSHRYRIQGNGAWNYYSAGG